MPFKNDAQRKAAFANMENGYKPKGRSHKMFSESGLQHVPEKTNKMLMLVPVSKYVGARFFTDSSMKDKKFDIDETEYSSDGKISNLTWDQVKDIFEHLQGTDSMHEAQQFLNKVRIDENIECRDCKTHFHSSQIERHKREAHGY